MVFIELFNFSFFSVTGREIDLDYCSIEWFALEMNRDHSVIFETCLVKIMVFPVVMYECESSAHLLA